MINAEQGEHFAASRSPVADAKCAQSVTDIFLGRQMRKQGQILLYVPNAPFPGGHIALLLRLIKFFSTHGDAAFIRITQSGNAIEQCSFSRARRAKQNGESGQSAEVNVQVKTAFRIWKTLTDADFELGGDCRQRCRQRSRCSGRKIHRHGPTAQTRRFTPYTTDNTTNEITSRTAAA